jgi:hypothetical protein
MTTYFRTMKKTECVTTRTPGTLKVNPLPLILLGTTLALFISLPITSTSGVTLVESIFGRLENQKVRVEK